MDTKIDERSITLLFIALAIGAAVGHIFTVERVYEPSLTRAPGETSSPYPPWPEKRPRPTPLLRSNDRSRWATIRSLVDNGTYVVGHRDPAWITADNRYGDRGIVFEDGWTTVDKVLRPDTHDFYSSKPPLLPTLLAGEYWLLRQTFGWSLDGDPSRWWVVRVILLTVNVVPLGIYLWLLAGMSERLGTTIWSRLFLIAAACFGTVVTAFVGTLNNHTIATYCVLFSLAPSWRILFGTREQDAVWRYALAGLFAACAACFDLPATAFAAALFGLLVVHAPFKTMLAFVPAAAVPIAGFFLCNYLAIGQLQPAYSEFGGPWYDYPGSNWQPNAPPELRRGIDWASEKETWSTYAMHFFVGHHGIFSLTPIWLLSAVGLIVALLHQSNSHADMPRTLWQRWGERRVLALLTMSVSVVVIAFYLRMERWNYGGWTVGPRWLMWLTPLWLLALLPLLDRISASRWGRGFALVLLALSALSAVVPDGIAWHHPWIYMMLDQAGALPY